MLYPSIHQGFLSIQTSAMVFNVSSSPTATYVINTMCCCLAMKKKNTGGECKQAQNSIFCRSSEGLWSITGVLWFESHCPVKCRPTTLARNGNSNAEVWGLLILFLGFFNSNPFHAHVLLWRISITARKYTLCMCILNVPCTPKPLCLNNCQIKKIVSAIADHQSIMGQPKQSRCF